MNSLLLQVKATIAEHKLLTKGDRVLVALSGGADSVCLLEVLLLLKEELGISVSAAHLHHGLRGEAADEDALFAETLCRERNVPFYLARASVKTLAKENKMSMEEAGRCARYEFFAKVQKEQGIHKIATAHHADDNIETVLMRLVRGTGPKGLAGIPYRNGAVIRPLLDVSRKEIESFLSDMGQSYCTDETNFEREFTRNKIRHSLIPAIEKEFNPNFRETFREQIRLYTESAVYLESETEKAFRRLAKETEQGYSFDCTVLRQEPTFLLKSVLHFCLSSLLADSGAANCHTEGIYRLLKAGQGALSLPEDMVAEICHGKLYIHKRTKAGAFFHPLPEEGEFFVPETGTVICLSLVDEVPEKTSKDRAYLKPELLAGKTLYVRSRREGDSIFLTETGGRKKLQDYFVDQKVPRFCRDVIPIVATDEDVLWVGGYRVNGKYKAKAGKQKAVLLTIHKGESKW